MITKKWLWFVLAMTLIVTVAVPLVPQTTAYAASTVTNGNFGTTGTQTPTGWSTTGTASADYTESGGRTGYRLTHWSASAYTVSTWQTLTGLSNGNYTLSVWVETTGGQKSAYLGLTCDGAAEKRANFPVSSTWTQVSVVGTVTNGPNGTCKINIYSDANAGNWASFDDVTFVAGGSTTPPPITVGPYGLTNGDFGTVDTQTPTGWSSSGTEAADYTESGGRTGERLTHYSASAYSIATWQGLTGMPDGAYTLRVWTKTDGSQNAAFVGFTCGNSPEQRTNLPVSHNDWVQIAVSARLSDGSGKCWISLYSDANAGNWAAFDDVTVTPGGSTLPILGGDLSGLKKNEDFGAQYFDEQGNQADAIQVLKDHGMNYARLKIWLDPADGYNNKARVLEMAQRIKAQGMKLLIDFHYSDFWTDPGQQATPKAWANYTMAQLPGVLYDYTYDVINSLVAQGTTPDMVQVGNEINSGMDWSIAGKNWDSAGFDNLAALLKAGYNAVKAASPSTLVMLHLAEGGNNGTFRWWFDSAKARGVQWDVTGASYYGYWHGTLAALQYNLNDMAARYGKPVVVAETSYPFTLADKDGWENSINKQSELVAGYPATPAGQAANLADIMSIVRAVPGGMGLGVFYWEPAWTAVQGNGWDPTDPSSGNAWENQALFDFNGKPLPAMNDFQNAANFVGDTTGLTVAPATGTYGGNTTLSAQLSSNGAGLGGKNVIFSLNGKPVGSATTNSSGVATLSNVSLAGIGGGTYNSGVTARFDGDGRYAPSSNSAALTVNRADQTISFAALSDKTYGDAPVVVSATAASGLPVSFSAGGNCTVNGDLVTITGAGTCTITATQPGDANYNAAPAVSQTFNIAKADQTIDFPAISTHTLGDADFALSATASSGLPVSYSATGSCTVSATGQVHISQVGPCTVTATQAGNENYNAASASQTFAVIYKFNGFFAPVNNSGGFNEVKAGSAVPVKFSLNGNQGLNVLAAGYPKSEAVDCGTGASLGDVQATNSNGGLTYDPATDTYTYVWKTDKSWANTCRQLTVRLADGTTHTALFSFR